MQYGLDVIYPKLQWEDKAQIIDIANRMGVPFLKQAFNRVIVDILLQPYELLIASCSAETLI